MNDFNSSPFEDLLEPNAGANPDNISPNVETEEFTVDWCKKKLNSIRSKYNTNVIDFLIKVILPQVGADKIIPILIGLCPTPESRGHESLGGEGRRDPERKTALSVLLMRLLNECLPTREQGGIYSGNPDVSNGAWLNAREMCTNDGVTCILCKSWFKVEGVDVGKALCALSKCVKYYGGHTVAVNMAGVSVNTHYLFDYLRAHGRFDGLCEYGTHISKLGSKCRAWTKPYQCNMAASTLAAIDKAFKPSFEQIGFKPSYSFLQMGLQNPLFKYVTESGNVATFAETCTDCGVCGATVVDMLQMESSTVNESSFNEGQDEEEEDDHECSDDGDNIACCMVCDKCAQARARVNEYDDEGNFMPISEFRQESKRAASRKYSAARRAKLKEEDPEKYEEQKAASRKRAASRKYSASRYAKIKEDPEKLEKHNAAQRERDAARNAKIKQDPEKLKKHTAAQRERDAARYAKIKEDPEKLAARRERDAAWYAKIKHDPEKLEKHTAAQRERDAARYAKIKEDPEKLAARRERDAASAWRAKLKEERIVNKKSSLLHEAHLQGALKQVLGDDTGADEMHKMLEDHASSLPTVQTPLIHLTTFRSWWNDFDSRSKPFDRRKEGLIQVMISFCKSWGVTVVKLTNGDHGLKFRQLHERVIVSEVRLDSPFAGKVSIDDQVVSIDAKDVKQMSAEDIQLSLSEENRLNVHLTLVSPLSEYDVYLQQLLWEDGDFVRAVEATHQQENEELEEVIVECEGLEQQSNQKQKKRTAKSTKSATNTKRLVSALSDAAPHMKKKKVKLAKLVISDNKIGVRETSARVVSPAELDSVEEDNTNNAGGYT